MCRAAVARAQQEIGIGSCSHGSSFLFGSALDAQIDKHREQRNRAGAHLGGWPERGRAAGVEGECASALAGCEDDGVEGTEAEPLETPPEEPRSSRLLMLRTGV